MPVGYEPMTLAQLAGHLRGVTDHELRWRFVLEFLEEFGHEPVATRHGLLEAEPTTTTDDRWDLLLAALAEHLSRRDAAASPPWSQRPDMLWRGKAWFVDPHPAAQAWALAHSPSAFRRRGIFLHPVDLERA